METVTALTDWLRSGDEADRCYAARALGVLGDARSVDALIERLHDDDIDVCIDAVNALGAIGDPRVVPALIESLENDPDGEVGAVAVPALGRLGGAEVVQALIRVAAARPEHLAWNEEWDYWWDMQLQAVEALGRLRAAAAIPMLRGILDDESGQDIEIPVLIALARIGGAGIELLIERLQGGSARERRRAARALAEAEAGGEPVVRALGRALQDGDGDVRAAAIAGLTRLDARAYAGAILLMLNDAAPEVRSAAITACSAWSGAGSDRDALVAELTELLDDNSATVRAASLRLLQRMVCAPLDEPLSDKVSERLADPDDIVAEEACRLLRQAGSAELTAPLLAVLQDARRAPAVRREAALTLGAVAEPSEPLCLQLADALLDAEQPVRFGAVHALAALDRKVGAETALRPLNPLLQVVSAGIAAPEEEAADAVADTAAPGADAEAATDQAALDAALADHTAPQRFEEQPDPRGAASTLDAIAMDNVSVALALHEQATAPDVIDAGDDAELAEFHAIVERVKADRDFLFPERNVPVGIDVRRIAAHILGDSDRPEAVAALLHAINTTDDAELRQAATGALQRIAERRPDAAGLADAFGTLVTQLSVGDGPTRVLAARTLGSLRNRAALAALLDALGAEPTDLRIAALHAATELVLHGRDPLIADDMDVAAIPDDRVITEVLARLDDEQAGVRLAAAAALECLWPRFHTQLDRDEVIDRLIATAYLGDGEQARAMGRTLRRIDPQAANRHLIETLNSRPTSAERRFAIEMIEELFLEDAQAQAA